MAATIVAVFLFLCVINICLSVWLPVRLSACLSVCLSVLVSRLYVCLSVWLSVCLSVWLTVFRRCVCFYPGLPQGILDMAQRKHIIHNVCYTYDRCTYILVYIIYLNNIYHIMLYNQTKFPISPDYTPVHMSWHLMIGGWRLSPAGNPFRCMCCARTHILPNQIQGKNHTQWNWEPAYIIMANHA